jgi:hypothetical protein
VPPSLTHTGHQPIEIALRLSAICVPGKRSRRIT